MVWAVLLDGGSSVETKVISTRMGKSRLSIVNSISMKVVQKRSVVAPEVLGHQPITSPTGPGATTDVS